MVASPIHASDAEEAPRRVEFEAWRCLGSLDVVNYDAVDRKYVDICFVICRMYD